MNQQQKLLIEGALKLAFNRCKQETKKEILDMIDGDLLLIVEAEARKPNTMLKLIRTIEDQYDLKVDLGLSGVIDVKI